MIKVYIKQKNNVVNKNIPYFKFSSPNSYTSATINLLFNSTFVY